MSFTELATMIRLRWALVLFCIGVTMAGGYLTARNLANRYRATADVILKFVEPDDDLGVAVSERMIDRYVGTQARIAVGSSTTRRMIEQFGWLSDPGLQDSYAAEGQQTGMSMETWLSERVAGAAGVEMLPESNIMRLSYQAPDPDTARQFVDALRDAYLMESLAEAVDTAQHALAALEPTLTGARGRYEAAVRSRTGFARANGLVVLDWPAMQEQLAQQEAALQAGGRITSTSTLDRAVSSTRLDDAGSLPVPQGGGDEESQRWAQAELDLAAALRTKPASVRIAFDNLQGQVQVARQAYLELARRVIKLRITTQATEGGVVAFGESKTSRTPVFPDYKRILPTSGGLGLVLGIELAVLLELLNRRVRWRHHLDRADAPVLVTIGRRPAELIRLHDRLRRLVSFAPFRKARKA